MTGRGLLEADALRSFAVFAEHRNFTTAAAALHVSQPSLHVKIAKLAAALGTSLYERKGNTLVLTASGEQLAAFALDARRRVDDFLASLGQQPATLAIAAGRGTFRWVIGGAIRTASLHGPQDRGDHRQPAGTRPSPRWPQAAPTSRSSPTTCHPRGSRRPRSRPTPKFS